MSATFDAIDSAKEIVTAVEHSRDKVDFKKRFSLKGIVYIWFYNCSMTLSVRIFGIWPANLSGGPLTIAHAWRYVALLALHPF